MIFQHFLLDNNEVNCFVIGCEETKEAALIDAGLFESRIVDYIKNEGLNLKYIILTHADYDHTDGLTQYQQAFPKAITARKVTDYFYPNYQLAVNEGDTIQIGKLNGKIFETPGHCIDSILIYFAAEKIMFVGDAVFAGAIGGTRCAEHKQQLLDGIHKHILSLPEDVELLNGHGPATTVGIEKRFNPIINEKL